MCFNPAHQRADSVQHHIHRYLQQTLWKQLWSFVCEARLTVLWWSCWQMHCTGSVLSLWPGSRWALCAVCSAGFACGLWAMEIWCGQPNSGNGQVGTHTAMTGCREHFHYYQANRFNYQPSVTVCHYCNMMVVWCFIVKHFIQHLSKWGLELNFFFCFATLYWLPLRPSNPLDGSTLR